MDPTSGKFVDDAENIRTSGRWSALNANLKRIAAMLAHDDAWYVDLASSLAYHLFSEYLRMEKDYTDNTNMDASLLAWRARNLLELLVWCTYCSKSRDNARRLYEDAGRDVRELFNAFKAWGVKTEQSC
jgi:hypothetical protein